jgi:E3 ubiquitin-protein ligase DOA10
MANQELRCCRICLDSDNEEDLIAPCVCKGSHKWVHRACLDKWRCSNEEAFRKCSDCKTSFVIDINPDTNVNKQNLQRMLLMRFHRLGCSASLVLQRPDTA